MAPPQINPLRFKTSLKMAISRLRFVQEKKTALLKQQRRQLADLLSQGKETSATIRVENVIRDDIYIELLEYLELYCELLQARISMILDVGRTTVDQSLREAIALVIYAAPHTELKELVVLREFFVAKYGPEFVKLVLENKDNEVPDKIVKRCVVDPPPPTLVELYLSEIARAYHAPYLKLPAKEEEDEEEDEDDGSGGHEVPVPEPAEPAVGRPSARAQDRDDFDALKARFAALKAAK